MGKMFANIGQGNIALNTAINTFSLNVCSNQMFQGLSYLLLPTSSRSKICK